MIVEHSVAERYLGALAPNSRRAVAWRLGLAAAILADFRGRPLRWAGFRNESRNVQILRFSWQTLQPRELAHVVSTLRAQDYSPATVNAVRAAVLGVARLCLEAGAMYPAILTRLREVPGLLRRRGAAVGRVVSGDEIASMFRVLAGDMTARGRLSAATLALAVATGARRFELGCLAVGDFDADRPAVTIARAKGGGGRTLPVPGWVVPVVTRWLAVRGRRPGPLLCRVSRRGYPTRRPLGGAGVYGVLRHVAEAARVSRFTPHDLRRTLLTGLLAQGVDPLAITTVSGHSDPRGLVPYDLRRQNAAQRAVEALPDPTGGAWVPNRRAHHAA